MDLHSRFIVGWALSAVNDRHLTLSALDKALKRRCAEAGLLHHSDQGCTYASEDYRTRLDAHGITCSISRRGNCYHNAVMESWFSTVKSEEAERFESYAHAKEALFDYIEVFYEPAALTLHARSDQLRSSSAASMLRRRHGGALGLPLHAANRCVIILNHMVQYSGSRLDASFAALSDATRRGVLEQLGRADASITDLAEKFHMTLTGMKKHVGVLEQAGLVTTAKVGRVRTCRLGLRRLDEEAAWIERYRQLWDARFDELDKVVEELKRKEKVDGRKKRE